MENKQLQQAKDTIAKKYGYENFEQFDDKSTFGYNHNTPKIIDEISIEYHRLMSECESVYYGQFEKCPDEIGVFLNSEGDDLMDDDIMITHWKKLPQPTK
jgi:hypothetical protein